MLSKEEREKARELCAKATQPEVLVSRTPPGWTEGQLIQFCADNIRAGKLDHLWLVAKLDDPDEPAKQREDGRWDDVLSTAITGNGPTSEANACFYTACHTLLPAALDTIDDLERELAEARELKRLVEEMPNSYELWHTCVKDDGTEWVVFYVTGPGMDRQGDGKTPLEALRMAKERGWK